MSERNTWKSIPHRDGESRYVNMETDWEIWKVDRKWLLYAPDDVGTSLVKSFTTFKEAKEYAASEVERITVEEAVERLQSLAADQVSQGRMGDPEKAHTYADEVLLSFVPTDVRQAYELVVSSSRWWAAG